MTHRGHKLHIVKVDGWWECKWRDASGRIVSETLLKGGSKSSAIAESQADLDDRIGVAS